MAPSEEDCDHDIRPHINEIVEYKGDLVRITATPYTYDYTGVTRVYQRNYSEVFHSDKTCPNLLANAGPDRTTDADRHVGLSVLSLHKVLSSWTDPVRACDHCTLPIRDCARVAVGLEGMDAHRLKFFEPGQKRVNTTVRRTPDGDVKVSESTEVIQSD